MTEIIGVRFRGGPKEYFFDPRGITVEPGQFVIVETAAGQEYACCVTGNHEAEDSELVQPLRPLLRVATENDRRTWEMNRAREKDAFGVCRKKIAAHGLDMKLVKVEGNFDFSKIIFYFTSDGRVDFRALVRDLASEFRARIELRQIGVRDEAKLLGGVGICGRPFCCAEFLDGFIPVSIKMAKTQNLSLNPAKISGTCGRLMCCLKYEQNAYEDAVRRCPKQDSFVLTPDGTGNITNVDILREQSVVRLDDAPEVPKRYRNCELNVLRNGRGARDGVEIPRERPARWHEPGEEDAAGTLAFDGGADQAKTLSNEGAGERRRPRGDGHGRRHGGESSGGASTLNREKPRQPKQSTSESEKPQQKPTKAAGNEKPAMHRHGSHRGGRGHRGGGAPKSEN